MKLSNCVRFCLIQTVNMTRDSVLFTLKETHGRQEGENIQVISIKMSVQRGIRGIVLHCKLCKMFNSKHRKPKSISN